MSKYIVMFFVEDENDPELELDNVLGIFDDRVIATDFAEFVKFKTGKNKFAFVSTDNYEQVILPLMLDEEWEVGETFLIRGIVGGEKKDFEFTLIP